MDNTENLTALEAAGKIKEIAGNGEICFMISSLGQVPCSVRPMAAQRVDEEGNIYFFSGAESHKNRELKQSEDMQLVFANTSRSEFMVLYGKAEAYRDQLQIDAMWNMFAKTWFHEGKEDPKITVIKFKPESGKYWDTKHGKFVQMLGLLYGAVTGKQTDDSLSGKIRVKKTAGKYKTAKAQRAPVKKNA
ncbi:MAG: pyridoxamine 5'-phosphate oxidase family protein, partial [Bacteroidia bacterium]